MFHVYSKIKYFHDKFLDVNPEKVDFNMQKNVEKLVHHMIRCMNIEYMNDSKQLKEERNRHLEFQ